MAIVTGVVEDPLDLDGRKLGIDGKGFSIGSDGLPVFGRPGIDGCIPCEVFNFYDQRGHGLRRNKNAVFTMGYFFHRFSIIFLSPKNSSALSIPLDGIDSFKNNCTDRTIFLFFQ